MSPTQRNETVKTSYLTNLCDPVRGEIVCRENCGEIVVYLLRVATAFNCSQLYNDNKKRVLAPGHQGWNDLHSLCRIGMEYHLLNMYSNATVCHIIMVKSHHIYDDNDDNNDNNDDDDDDDDDTNNNNNNNDDDTNNNTDNDYNVSHNNDAKGIKYKITKLGKLVCLLIRELA